ncbi:YggS family pyridoxal phosphate-dependent enzyme [Bacteroidales bacterium OttesenSCG-928-M06]|nr:YggS family pyridoxal phosphate-dependent enzyme [Bacteroidales bacterium OttesenSCG-928-M06]
MNIAERLYRVKKDLPTSVELVAVSKFHSSAVIKEAYDAGQRLFGESRVQELTIKYDELPKDIKWHFIGHLQLNKIKYIAHFIDTIQSVDSIKLMEEINKYAEKYNRIIHVLIQIHIAKENHKYGFSFEEAEKLFSNSQHKYFPHLHIQGLMGMSTFTEQTEQIQKEFSDLASYYKRIKKEYFAEDTEFNVLSMGMSDDYPIAIKEGSSMIRVGSKIFGERQY